MLAFCLSASRGSNRQPCIRRDVQGRSLTDATCLLPGRCGCVWPCKTQMLLHFFSSTVGCSQCTKPRMFLFVHRKGLLIPVTARGSPPILCLSLLAQFFPPPPPPPWPQEAGAVWHLRALPGPVPEGRVNQSGMLQIVSSRVLSISKDGAPSDQPLCTQHVQGSLLTLKIESDKKLRVKRLSLVSLKSCSDYGCFGWTHLTRMQPSEGNTFSWVYTTNVKITVG